MSPVLSTFSGASARAFGLGYSLGATSAYEHIETQTVGAGGAASVTFSSIPGTYKHLQIRGISQTASATNDWDWLYIRCNSDTGSNYARHHMYGNGATTTTGGNTSVTSAYALATIWRSSADAFFAASVIDLLDYANTSKNKTFRSLGGWETNGAGVSGVGSGLWMSTNAVTSITLFPFGSNTFRQYTTFALYGIK